MLKNWLKIAFINYKKNWLSTFINLFGLTLGLTGFMLILLHWNDEASYEQWNPQKKDIYFLQQYYKTEDWTNNNMSYQMTKTATDELPEIEDFVMFASVSIFSFLLTFLGPYGLELYSFLYQYRDTFYLMHVSEWLPVYYPTVMASKFFYLIITIAFLIFSIFYTRFKKINIFSFLLTLIFLVLSIKSKRHFPLLFICSIYFIVDYLILIFDEISIRADNFIEKMHFLNKKT